jgi:hypothetical protein
MRSIAWTALALVWSLIALPALAQQAPDQEFTIKLKRSEVAAIELVLTKCPMPWEQSNALLQAIVSQVDPSQKPADKPGPEEKK